MCLISLDIPPKATPCLGVRGEDNSMRIQLFALPFAAFALAVDAFRRIGWHAKATNERPTPKRSF
jgi:hypothetical protein